MKIKVDLIVEVEIQLPCYLACCHHLVCQLLSLHMVLAS